MKNIFFFSFIILFLFIGCTGENQLSGTYEWNYPYRQRFFENLDNKYETTISFSGKNFAIDEYPILVDQEGDDFWSNGFNYSMSFHRPNNFENVTLFDESSVIVPAYNNTTVDFKVYRNSIRGTFSITNDKIEFVYSDGYIDIFDFSQTENTLTITDMDGNSFRFNRKR